jgi:hypothetical protein
MDPDFVSWVESNKESLARLEERGVLTDSQVRLLKKAKVGGGR